MKSFKKILSVFFVLAVVVCLTACGGNKGGSGIFSKSLKASDLNIDDFVWKTEKMTCSYGYSCYGLTLTNNSKYDLIGLDFTYKVKDSVSDSELEIFRDFMNDHDGYIDEDDSPRDVTLRDTVNTMILAGETYSHLSFTVGFKQYSWYDYPTDKQFDLMEPKELQIGVISDGTLYIAYYDFVSKSWRIDDETAKVDNWPNTEIAKLIVKPETKHFVVRTDKEDEFKFYAYGFDKDGFKAYYEKVKESGFVDDDPGSINYNAEKDGYEVDIWFDDKEKSISVTIEKD